MTCTRNAKYGDSLTPRELELVGALLRGELGNASQTIKNQFRLIYQKLGIPSGDGRFDMRCALVARAYAEGAFWLLTGEESPAERGHKRALEEQAKKEADAPLIRIREQFARTGKVPDTPLARRALGMRL